MYLFVGFPIGMSSSLLMGQHVSSVGLLIDFISEKEHTLLLGVCGVSYSTTHRYTFGVLEQANNSLDVVN